MLRPAPNQIMTNHLPEVGNLTLSKYLEKFSRTLRRLEYPQTCDGETMKKYQYLLFMPLMKQGYDIQTTPLLGSYSIFVAFFCYSLLFVFSLASCDRTIEKTLTPRETVDSYFPSTSLSGSSPITTPSVPIPYPTVTLTLEIDTVVQITPTLDLPIVAVPTTHRPELYNSISDFLISNETCSLPCWHDIHPGSSTEADFQEIMTNSDEKIFSELYHYQSQSSESYYQWFDSINQFYGTLYIDENGIVSIVYIDLVPTNVKWNSLRLEDLIEELGIPDAYSASVYLEPHGSFVFSISWLYYDIGLVIHGGELPFTELSSAFLPSCEVAITSVNNLRVSMNIVNPETLREAITADPKPFYLPAVNRFEPWPVTGAIKLTECWPDPRE